MELYRKVLRVGTAAASVKGTLWILGIAVQIAVFSGFAQAQKPHVLMISIDGMKPEYVTQAKEHNLHLPVLQRFLTNGSYADGVIGVIPTVTYPSHTTLITGVWPAEHGIYANTTFDPFAQHPGEWYWYFKELKAETLYQASDEAGLTTAAVGWPVTVGAPIDYLIAEHAQSEDTATPEGSGVEPADLLERIGNEFPRHTSGDEKKTQWAIGIIDRYNPNLVLVHLTALDHQEHEHAPFSTEADDTIETIDGQVGRIMDAELKKSPDAKVVIVSDHGFVRIDHKVALNVLFERVGLLKLRPGHVNDGAPQVASWEAQTWDSGGTAAVMVRDQTNQAVMKKVEQLLAMISADPQYGVNKVIGHDQIVKHGGNPDAAFLIDFKPGWASTGSLHGAVLRDAPSTGTHGYLPEHPELRSTFMICGAGVAQGRDLGVIDMRQIAPTVAEILGVKLPRAPLQPVHYE